MADTDVIVQDPASGLFGFRIELGRDRAGTRMQARRGGFTTDKAALGEFLECGQCSAARPHGGRSPRAPRRGRVSIGTLYNYFPTRESLFDAIFPARTSILDEQAAVSLADPDPWTGFVSFTEALFALHAEDRGLNDALAQRVPLSPALIEACHRCFGHLEALIARAKESGQLRADFEFTDFAGLIWAMSQIVRESVGAAPSAWRRSLGFFLDGLRADAATPLPVPPLTSDQLAAILGAR